MWDRIRLISSSIWDFLRPALAVFLSNVGPVLANAAIAAVTSTAVNMPKASGAEKRTAAEQMIRKELTAQGVILGASVINMAIEAAVQKLKQG